MKNHGVERNYRSELKFPEGTGFTPGEIFNQVYFRINTPSYRNKGIGFQSPAEEAAFYQSVRQFMSQFGFEAGQYANYIHASPCEKLHIHPDEISGVVRSDKIQAIHDAIAELPRDSVFFSFGCTDVYQPYELVDREEVLKRLQYWKSDIKTNILESLATKSKGEFKEVPVFSYYVRPELGFSFTLKDSESRAHSGSRLGQHFDLVEREAKAIFDDLERAGLLVSSHSSSGHYFYRSANKTEQRALKKVSLLTPSNA